MSLTDEQIDRYSRQIILPEVGGRGQQRLLAACVEIAGDGDLTAWTARYLCAAGIGRLRLPSAAGDLRGVLAALNSDCLVEDAARETPQAIVVSRRPAGDGRWALSEEEAVRSGWRAGVPVIAVGAGGEVGALTALSSIDAASACPACAEIEVDGAASPSSAGAFLATLAATETIKLILGVGAPPFGRRLVYDARQQSLREESAGCRPDCGRGAR